MVARAMVELGQQQQGEAIAEAALAHIERTRKLQTTGWATGIDDAVLLMILGREDEGLDRLEAAIDQGWRFYSMGLYLYAPPPLSEAGLERYETLVSRLGNNLAEDRAWYQAHRDKVSIN